MTILYKQNQIEKDKDLFYHTLCDGKEDCGVCQAVIRGVMKKIVFTQGRNSVEKSMSELEKMHGGWMAFNAFAKLREWCHEMNRRTGAFMLSLQQETDVQISKIGKSREKWNKKDWEAFIERMLEYIEENKENTLADAPKLLDYKPMGNKQYITWASVFNWHVQMHKFTYDQVNLEFKTNHILYPSRARETWSLVDGNIRKAQEALYRVCRTLDKETAMKKSKKVLEASKAGIERGTELFERKLYIDTTEPGEIMGIDLMTYQSTYVLIMIDYYSRLAFGFELESKDTNSILVKIIQVFKKFPFRKIIFGQSQEFSNTKIKEWAFRNKIAIYYKKAYYKEDTGRIKCLIATLRNSLNKTSDALNTKLESVIEKYNQSKHRTIGMSPNSALDPSRWAEVNNSVEKYKKRFVSSNKMKL
ncbi:hypothetical protein NEPAR06_1216 [Nematocida parisii]|nr:hypothetical protein NEPAR08_1338 [Nematocida parisii]KAI5144861.1 hypothetical protein NEPAR07_1319 [Nematocida parisii]KAI5154562.1 hypothetical protein NEPAR06_1216 [Nematocida parisii]KAI5157598.1 hypothetical protein NEPAR05_1421 [Nematocida parisii]